MSDIEILYEGHGNFLVRPLTPKGERLILQHFDWRNRRGGVYFEKRTVEALIADARAEGAVVESRDER